MKIHLASWRHTLHIHFTYACIYIYVTYTYIFIYTYIHFIRIRRTCLSFAFRLKLFTRFHWHLIESWDRKADSFCRRTGDSSEVLLKVAQPGIASCQKHCIWSISNEIEKDIASHIATPLSSAHYTIFCNVLPVTGHWHWHTSNGLRKSSSESEDRLGGSAGLLGDGTRAIQCKDCCSSSKVSKIMRRSLHVGWEETPFTRESTAGQLSTKIITRWKEMYSDHLFIATSTA